MKKVLLFNPQSGDAVRIIPNAILAIAASMEGLVEYAIVDGNRETDPLKKIVTYLTSGEFGYFASTVMPGPQLKQAIPFTKIVRKEFPNVKIIWGGYFASNHHKTVMDSGEVDLVVNGPGDKAFPAALRALDAGQELDNIENLIFKRNGEMIITRKANLYDQDLLPALPYDKLNSFYSIDEYLGRTFLGNKTIALSLQYGLPIYLLILRSRTHIWCPVEGEISSGHFSGYSISKE